LIEAPGSPDHTRFGLIVSKSVGNAVTRSRAKRRLRHTVRQAALQPGMDYVIIARKSVTEVSFDTLRGWVERALVKASDV
jgi:ribonuclease P protein component